MPHLIILGSANAIADELHENTHMAIVGKAGTILIDCVGSPVVRLRKAGLYFDDITDIVLTHFHPDHVSGVPLLLMSMWLLGRKKPVRIHGLAYTLERMEKVMGFFDWATWPNFYQVSFHPLPEAEMTLVIENQDFRIYSSPVHHLIPNIGLRVEALGSGKVVAYSCDTRPCDEVIRLAMGADILIHEAAGATIGHTSAAQAGEIARQAEVGRLYLIHYPTAESETLNLVGQAQATFPGEIALAQDFMKLPL